MLSRWQEKQDLSMLVVSHFYLMRTISTEVQTHGGAGIELSAWVQQQRMLQGPGELPEGACRVLPLHRPFPLSVRS